jgi:hypothetical protein
MRPSREESGKGYSSLGCAVTPKYQAFGHEQKKTIYIYIYIYLLNFPPPGGRRPPMKNRPKASYPNHTHIQPTHTSVSCPLHRAANAVCLAAPAKSAVAPRWPPESRPSTCSWTPAKTRLHPTEWRSDREPKIYMLVFVDCRLFSGQTWPQGPLKRVRFDKWCSMQLKSARRTDTIPFRDHFLVDHQN